MIRRVSLRPVWALALLGVVYGASTSHAQSTSTTPTALGTCQTATLVRIGDQDVDNMQDPRAVNLAECQANASIEVQLANAGGLTNQRMAVFVDYTDNSSQCSNGSLRYDGNDTTDEPCKTVHEDILLGSEQVRTLTIPILRACPGGENGNREDIANTGRTRQRTLWLLQLDNDMQTTASACYSVAVDFDTAPPTRPTGLNAPKGNTQFVLHWDQVNDDPGQLYHVLMDPNASAVTDGVDAGTELPCTSEALHDGMAIDLKNLPEGVLRVGKDIKASVNPSFELNNPSFSGDHAAVGVVVVDEAGNVSALSKVSCLTRVESCGIGDFDQCSALEEPEGEVDDDIAGINDDIPVEPMAGDDQCAECEGLGDGLTNGGCSTSALNQGHVAGAWPYLALLAGLWFRSRRRTS